MALAACTYGDGIAINNHGYDFQRGQFGIGIKAEFTLTVSEIALRVTGQFALNETGEISEQENCLDPRKVTG